MFICSAIVDGSTEEKVWKVTENARKVTEKVRQARIFIVWIQKANVVNDQHFDSFALSTESPVKTIRTSCRRKDYPLPATRPFATIGPVASVSGFIL